MAGQAGREAWSSDPQKLRHVFVTGGTGHIGRRLIPAVQARGHRVSALARPGREAALPPGCKAIAGDAPDAGHFPDIEVDLHSQPAPPPPKLVPPGSYGSAVIILLTDGANTAGPEPVDAAKMAADRGVRVYTVGIGTAKGTVVNAGGWSMKVQLDEETLKQVAGITRAEYFTHRRRGS